MAEYLIIILPLHTRLCLFSLFLRQYLFIKLIVHHVDIDTDETQVVAQLFYALHAVDTLLLLSLFTNVRIEGRDRCALAGFQ